mmetsp:Transcript_24171/g.45634  ORF Transcript_24171/g.45634 Transcript_24171/m.45634 type:complete len:166 (+) Transcript_24171:61-558(+)
MAVCPPAPRLRPAQAPFKDVTPLELPIAADEVGFCVEEKYSHAAPPQAPRLGPSVAPFDSIPEVWLPEAADTEDVIKEDQLWTAAPYFGPVKPGPSWEMRGACATLQGDRRWAEVRLPSSVCSTRCSSPGGLSQGPDSPWPADAAYRNTTMPTPVAFELLVNGGL